MPEDLRQEFLEAYERLCRRLGHESELSVRSLATAEEIKEALPGDELVPQPRGEAIHAVTINAPVEVVWG